MRTVYLEYNGNREEFDSFEEAKTRYRELQEQGVEATVYQA